MHTDFVIVAQPRRLGFRITSAQVGDRLFCDDEDASGVRQFNGRAQGSGTRANHNVIGLGWKTFHKRKIVPPPGEGMSCGIYRVRYYGNAMPQATIHVPPEPYQAWIENGLLNRAGSILSDLLPRSSRVFVVTVPPVRKRWGSKLIASLKAAGLDRKSTRL